MKKKSDPGENEEENYIRGASLMMERQQAIYFALFGEKKRRKM